MVNSFFDTSALVKYDHPEDGTQAVTAIFEAADSLSFVSQLSLVETVSAFAVKYRAGDIEEGEFEGLHQRFYYEIGQGLFRIIPVTTACYREAAQLIAKHFRTRLRTLDALQLAVALALSNRDVIENFVCADGSLCATAMEEGLPVIRLGDV
jgi:uncharacterized protein